MCYFSCIRNIMVSLQLKNCMGSYIPYIFAFIYIPYHFWLLSYDNLAEKMGEVEQSSCPISWDKLISMFLHLWIVKGEEVVLQYMRYFSSFGQFAPLQIVPWAAKEVARTASKLTVICTGTFPTYHVKMPDTAFLLVFIWPILILIISFNVQLHLYCQVVMHCHWETGSLCIFHVVQTLTRKLEKPPLR